MPSMTSAVARSRVVLSCSSRDLRVFFSQPGRKPGRRVSMRGNSSKLVEILANIPERYPTYEMNSSSTSLLGSWFLRRV